MSNNYASVIPPEFVLTPDEEGQLDLISNAIIDIILANRGEATKTPLPYQEKSNSVVVKGGVKQ